jgi:apolipoprotein N-acyltransferase
MAALGGSALLYAAAFPNPLITRGFFPAIFCAYIGVFWVVSRIPLGVSALAGVFFGALCVILHNYWLGYYQLLACVIVAGIFACYFALFFPALKTAAVLAPRFAPLVQCALWVGFEYLRTLGFLGYSYGISGYALWTAVPLIKIADIFGVWGLSAIVILPQACIAAFLAHKTERGGSARAFFSSSLVPLFTGLWALLFAAALIYGVVSPSRSGGARMIRAALLQPNSDPWKSGILEYRKELAALVRLSEAALREEPPPDVIVWPETAFVPSFYYHGRYRVDPDSTALVQEAERFLAGKEIPFVVGNNEGRRERGEDGRERVAQYNAALVFERGEIRGRYYKMKLVPFTEYFPYRHIFPAFYDFLQASGAHFWDPGTEPVVFEAAGARFATPICFEDSFGSVTREFALRGAELFVNLSNDSWAHSLSAQYQHLAISVFRAVETGRAIVRSTASGQTCAIAPSGAILAMAAPFTGTTLTVEVPLERRITLYTRFGDWLPRALLAAAALALALSALFERGRPGAGSCGRGLGRGGAAPTVSRPSRAGPLEIY